MSGVSLRAIYELVQGVRSSQDGRIERANFSEAVIAAALADGAVIEQSGRWSLPSRTVAGRDLEPTVTTPTDFLQNNDYLQSNDRAVREHGLMLEQCCQPDWLSNVVAEIELTGAETTVNWPEFAGLKLSNGDSAQRDSYLLYQGSRAAVLTAGRIITELDLPCEIAPLTIDRLYRLVIPLTAQSQSILADVA